MIEQTLSIIKPDAVERNLEDKIKNFFEEKNLKIKKNKKVKKLKFQEKRLRNFIKYIRPSHFITIFVIIYHQGQ